MSSRLQILRSTTDLSESVLLRKRFHLCSSPDATKTWDNIQAVMDIADLDRDCSVLDVGCRSGILPVWLGQLGFRRIAAVDIRFPFPPLRSALARLEVGTSVMCAAHVARYWSQMHRGRAESLPFNSNSFSVVACMSVLEHGVRVSEFFGEASRVLKPGGRLIISTDFWYEPRVLPNVGLFGPPDRIFTPGDMQELLEVARNAGFDTPAMPSPPANVTPPLSFGGRTYTFIYMMLSKLNR